MEYFKVTVSVLLALIGSAMTAEYTLGMDSETSCTRTHYYEAGDVFMVSANGMVHNGNCPMTFIQSGTWHSNNDPEPCVSVCIKILSYTMSSCKVRLSYHDGLNDFTPKEFDCHQFPPVLWCSSKNDLKLSVSEMKNYDEKNYALSLEVKPFCGGLDQLSTTDNSVISEPQSDPSPMSRTVIIIGAVVGTISILFVIGWLMYCYRKRHHPEESSNHTSHTDRNRGENTAQHSTRYVAVERNPQSSQSSSDRGTGTAMYREKERLIATNAPTLLQNRCGHSAFQPPNRGTPYSGPDRGPPFYSDLDRGPVIQDKWYPITSMGPAQPEAHSQLSFSSPTSAMPGMPFQGMNQFQSGQNPPYRPQHFTEEQEMHSSPTDTKYVVYDFDYPQPMERTYSSGKNRQSPLGDSPFKDMRDRDTRPREITPLRETVRVMDTTTTDHTSDNESSLSDTTEDDTTDDQMSPSRPYLASRLPYKYGPPVGGGPVSRFQDPRGFRPPDSSARTGPPNVPSFSRYIQPGSNVDSRQPAEITNKSTADQIQTSQDRPQNSEDTSGAVSSTIAPPSSREMPVPQVPPIPRDRGQPQLPPPPLESSWPQGPPPPYSREQTHLV